MIVFVYVLIATPFLYPLLVMPMSPEKDGLAMFHSRHERVEEIAKEDMKRRADTLMLMEGVSSDPSLTLQDKALFAETLREVSEQSFTTYRLPTVITYTHTLATL